MTGRQLRMDGGGASAAVVARRPDGRPVTREPLSGNPARYVGTVVAGVRVLLGRERERTPPPVAEAMDHRPPPPPVEHQPGEETDDLRAF